MYHISRRVGKTWDSLTQYLRRIEQLAAIRNTRIEAQPQSTAEQLTAIETQATEYTPPEGWRALHVGEELREGDVIVHTDDATYATARAGKAVQANQRYIRRIEPEPQPDIRPIESDKTQELPTETQELEGKTQELPEYTPPEGWRVLQAGERLRFGDIAVKKDGSCCSTERVGGWVGSYQRYIRPIESQPQPSPQPEPQAAAIEELRSEVSYVQRLLGESRQRVTHLEELVTSLRTINDAQEKAFNAANNANTDLQHRLNVVAAEWAEQAETIRRLQIELNDKTTQCEILQIELDAAQQVPADSAPMANNDVISRSDAVDAVVLTAVEHVVAIVARLHNTQVTPELHNTIVQAIGQLTAQSPEQHDAVIPPVVAEHCDAMPTLVQSVFYNIPDAG